MWPVSTAVLMIEYYNMMIESFLPMKIDIPTSFINDDEYSIFF